MTDHIANEIRKARLRFSLASLFLLLAFVGLSIVWNRSIKEELADQATSFVRKGMIATDMRSVMESLNGIQLSSFKHVTLFQPSGQRVVTLPPVFDYNLKSQSFWTILTSGTVLRDIYLDDGDREVIGRLAFAYSRFELVQYAALVWILATFALWGLVNPSIHKVQMEIQKEIKLKNAEVIEEVAKKIRHNIRSPLAVLSALFVDRAISKDDFLEQGSSAVRRLEEIVSEIDRDLRGEPKKEKAKLAIHEMTKVARAIVREKNIISKGVPISLKMNSSIGAVFSEVPSAELKATLSNLIDNSLQAFFGRGGIEVQLDADEHAIELAVVDQGKGISESVIENVFEKGFTHGKSGGTGLGLFYAKKLIEDYQGNVDINSVEGEGTIVRLHIPRKPSPRWHLDSVDLVGISDVVVCDDVPSILKAWELRLKEQSGLFNIHLCAHAEQIPELKKESAIYLLDYDMGPNRENGLSIARRLQLRERAVLVTGHFDAPEVQAACDEIGCKLLPKDEIASIGFNQL